jgi:hypothetical protein
MKKVPTGGFGAPGVLKIMKNADATAGDSK